MHPLQLLGFAPDADGAYPAADITPSAIRRAYAQRLKTTRPDDDPSGFQRLHEAYRAALEIAARLEQLRPADAGSETDAGAETSEQAGAQIDTPTEAQANAQADAQTQMPQEGAPAPVAGQAGNSSDSSQGERQADEAARPEPPAPPRQPLPRATWSFRMPAAPQPGQSPVPAFSADALVRELEQVAVQNRDPDVLLGWLQRHPALYALEDKANAGAVIARQLMQDGLAVLSIAQCKALASFFDFDLDPDWFRRRMVRDAIQTGNVGPYVGKGVLSLFWSPFMLRQITRPLRFPQAIWVTTLLGMSGDIAQLARRLRQAYGLPEGLWPPGLDATACAFYQRMDDPGYLGLWRWEQIALRCLVGIVLTGLMVGLFSVFILTDTGADWLDILEKRALFTTEVTTVAVTVVVLPLVVLRPIVLWFQTKLRARWSMRRKRSDWLWWLLTGVVWIAVIAAIIGTRGVGVSGVIAWWLFRGVFQSRQKRK